MPRLDPEQVDAAAEDPPLRWLTLAVVGLACLVAALVAVGLGVVGLASAAVTAVPVLAPVFDLTVPLALAGLALFAFAMTEWEKEIET